MSEYKKNKHFTKPSGEPMYQTHFSEDEIPIEVKNWFNENTTENSLIRLIDDISEISCKGGAITAPEYTRSSFY